MMKSNNGTPVNSEAGGINDGRKSSFRLLILFLLILFCSVFYYLGELIDWAAWDVLRNNFFYGIHDVHRLLFLAPIVYAAYVFGTRATIIVTIIAIMTFLPRALFISPYPDPLLRMVLSTVLSGSIGYLVALVREKSRRCCYLESLLEKERDKADSG